MMGTSIRDLNMKTQPDEYDNIRDIEGANHKVSHNIAHHAHQGQYMPYLNAQNDFRHPIQNQHAQINNIESLAKDINNSMPNGPAKDSDIDDAFLYDDDEENKYLVDYVPKIVREPLLILVLFVILSQPTVKDIIGKYVKQIVPDAQGKVSMTGVVIYGTILAVLFFVIKKYFL